MSDDLLDERFDVLQAQLSNLSSNLLALEQSPTRVLLIEMRPTGVTGAEWQHCERLLAGLFIDQSSVASVMVKALGFRAMRHRSRTESAEYRRLVVGSSVARERRRDASSARDLVAGSTVIERESISDVIDRMRPDFEHVWELLQRVEQCLAILVPALRDALVDVETAQHSAADAEPEAVDPELLAIERSLRAVAEAVAIDPLGVDLAAASELRDRAAWCRQAYEPSSDAIDAWPEEGELLEQRLVALAAQRDDVASLQARVASRFGSVSSCVVDAHVVDALIERWSKARVLASGGSWTPALRERAAIRSEAESLERVLSQHRAAAEAEFERRRELRGLLSGYQAKADRLSLLEDAAVDSALHRAEAALGSAPLDLDAAARLLADLGVLLTPLVRKS